MMSARNRLARIIGLLALTAALAACSAVKLGYNSLDQVAYWWLDGWVDFSDEQAARAREDLARLHRWHREHELPQLQSLLRSMEALAASDVTPAQACAFVPRLRERLNALATRAEPAVVTLAIGLAPEQIAHLERRYQRSNTAYRKDWLDLTAQEVSDKRFEQFLERGETMYGKLDERQRAVLRRQVEQSVFDPQRLAAERLRRQQDALRTLREMAAPGISLTQARGLLQGYLQRVQESPDAAYRSWQDALIAEACRNIATLHNSTSPAQRESAARRLRAYQRDLAELSAPQ